MAHAEESTAHPGPQPRPWLRSLATLALGLATLGRPAPASADEAQAESGFALESTLGGKTTLLTTGLMGAATAPANGLDVGLLAGYKLGRFLFGLGLDFSNLTTAPPAPAQSASASSFLIGPEISAAIVRSGDNRVELVGDLALHFGHLFVPTGPNPLNLPTASNFLLNYQVGPGVRFWAHKHFALQALTGFAGELFHDIPPARQAGTGDTSVHGIFASFGMIGVF
jgi:hypothetical protein